MLSPSTYDMIMIGPCYWSGWIHVITSMQLCRAATVVAGKSMLRKRFTAAGAALNGSIFVAGGFDDVQYISSAERFDPREGFWTEVHLSPCHTLAMQ